MLPGSSTLGVGGVEILPLDTGVGMLLEGVSPLPAIVGAFVGK